jgi:proline iminopeptidase
MEQTISSFEIGNLKVDGGHVLYYEVYGNPKGIPVLFIHGGPGAGFSDRDKRFFDPRKFKVVFYDQRGASRSTPFCSIENNNIDWLIADILTLLSHLNLPKVYIVAGSWGTTLALAFAIKYPEKISSMILRGVFLGSKKEIRHFLGGGVKLHFPREWERFESLVPEPNRGNIPGYYFNMMASGDEFLKDKYAMEWARYELSIFKIELNDQEIDELIKLFPYQSLAYLEAYYLSNDCFLPDNYIMENLNQIRSIPISIIQGRFDVICPPFFVYQFCKHLEMSTLTFLNAGHSDSEPAIEKAIINELANINDNICLGSSWEPDQKKKNISV